MPDAHIIGDHYRIDERIGQGGMGAVYRGIDLRTQLVVAIKELKPELIQSGSDSVQRFEREAEALRKLNHPNIVKVLASITEVDHHYIVMEYVGGGALDDLLQDGFQLPIDRVLDIALDLADALTRAHRLKIIHRDIKPANVMLREDGSPLLTDFGVARIGNTTRMTAVGTVVGTLAYLPPEALRSEPVDERLDIWAFGVMLYEMVAGQHPFISESTGGLLMNIMNQPAPDLFHYRSDIPWTLMGLIYWMLEKDPADRPSSVRLIGAMLENIMSGTVIPVDWFGNKGSTPPPDSGEYRPNREQAIRAVMEYTTTAFRLDSGKSSTPTPTDAASLVDLGIEPPKSTPPAGTPTGVMGSSAPTTGVTLPALPPRRVPMWVVWSLALGLAVLALLLLIMQPRPVTPTAASTPVPATEAVVIAPVAANEHMALVAQFEHLGGEERDVTRFVVEDLQRNLEDNTYSDVHIRAYPQVIRDSDTARQIAEQVGADVIIWGNYDAEGITAEIQVGSAAKYTYITVGRADLEQLMNVRATMVNERRETLSYNVIAVLNGLASWNGDAFSLARNLLILQSLDDPAATTSGNSIAAHFHQFIQSYVGDPATSISEMTEAIRLDANNPMLYDARALAFQHLGDMEKSRADISTAERLMSPDWAPTLLLHMTDSFFISPDYQAAFHYIDELTKQHPTDWYPLAFRGISRYMLADYKAAEADLRASIALHPQTNFPFTFAIATALRRGDVLEAQHLFRQVLEQFPDPTLVENLLLVTLSSDSAKSPIVPLTSAFGNVTLHRWQDVLVNTQPSVDANIQMADPYLLRGLAYCNLDQYQEAEAAYSKALDIDSSYSLIYLLRAAMRQKLNNPVGALSDLTTALARPELAQLAPLMSPDNMDRLTCKTFLDADLSGFMSISDSTAAADATTEATP